MVKSSSADILSLGLRIHKAGEGLETVASRTGEVQLLFSKHGTELVEATVKAGEKVTIIPPDRGAEMTEAYYVLQGSLRCDLPTGELTVGAGDRIVVSGLEEPVIFDAETDVRFLYITSRPSFHRISGELRQLMRLAVEVEQKDGYTASHCQRIQSLSYATGKLLGLPHHRLHALDYGAYLHDAGKVEVPLEVLNKPAALTPVEWEIIRQHPVYGKEMVERTFMEAAGPIVEQHHERSDGSGYPYGLSEDDILVEAFIVAVADSFDAMTTDRPYRRAFSVERALEEIQGGAGRLYPAEVVDAFVAVVKAERAH